MSPEPGTAGRFGLAAFLLAPLLGLALLAGSATAGTPPKCHGKTATIWSRSDAPRKIEGTAGPDVIVTGTGNDRIDGGRGRDVICSHGGADVINGGSGVDRIYAGRGDDFVAGAHGDDVICMYRGRDAAFGGPGRDWISVGAGVNYYDADGKGDLDDPTYRSWIDDGYTYTVGIGSGENDVMTGGMIHVKGEKLAKRWRC